MLQALPFAARLAVFFQPRQPLQRAFQRSQYARVLNAVGRARLFRLQAFHLTQLAIQFSKQAFDHDVHPFAVDIVNCDFPHFIQGRDNERVAALPWRAGFR